MEGHSNAAARPDTAVTRRTIRACRRVSVPLAGCAAYSSQVTAGYGVPEERNDACSAVPWVARLGRCGGQWALADNLLRGLILRICRGCLSVPRPRIGRQRAVVIAQKEGLRRGWPIETPVVIERLRTWEVWIAPSWRMGAIVVVDNQSGEVLEFAYLPY